MKKTYKRKIIMNAIGAMAISGIAALLFETEGLSIELLLFLMLAAGICLVRLLYNLSLYRRTSEEEDVFVSTPGDLSHLEPAEQIRTVKWAMIVLLLLGVAGSAWTYYDLSALESGQQESTLLWYPIAIAYETVGFFPACFLPLFLTSILNGFGLFKLREIKKSMD